MIAVLMGQHLTFAAPVHVQPDPIKRSRFFGDGAPIVGAGDAMDFVHQIQGKYNDAGHHCFAWRLGAGDQGFRVSDDGEPGGTAGQPILNHIDGAELCGVVIVVTRYFGGTKLGKGGLIRAYGGTAGEAIAAAQIITVVQTEVVAFECDYGDQGTVDGVLRSFSIEHKNSTYGSAVSVQIDVPTEEVEALKRTLTDATSGRVRLKE
jgi:uncharacterized YigZ family protein